MPCPFPTFFAPAGSNAGPPALALVGTAVETGMISTVVAAEATGEAAAPLVVNPQPVFPFCVAAPRPEHIPVGLAQQVDAQSAFERHWPPINCWPALLPTFLAPAGSKGGTATARVDEMRETDGSVSGTA